MYEETFPIVWMDENQHGNSKNESFEQEIASKDAFRLVTATKRRQTSEIERHLSDCFQHEEPIGFNVSVPNADSRMRGFMSIPSFLSIYSMALAGI